MIKYRVIDVFTGADITHVYPWVIRPDGELGHIENGNYIRYKTARVVLTTED